jgi:hypothetical protein
VCNFGKLNYYLGARAAKEGRESKYPSVDFCKDPEVICSSSEYKELKWVAGMFYWMESVQSYNEGGWNYMDELAKFVEGGMQGTSFIDAVSGIVNRGCHNPVRSVFSMYSSTFGSSSRCIFTPTFFAHVVILVFPSPSAVRYGGS